MVLLKVHTDAGESEGAKLYQPYEFKIRFQHNKFDRV
jgi:hypothetical protein